MEAILFIGIQGAGKSTFYKERFFDSHLRLSLDLLRTRGREKQLFEACLKAKQRLVVDNTNALVSERARFIAPAKAAGFRAVGYFFDVPLREALERNARREGAKLIPVAGVLATHQRLQRPTLAEGFDALFVVRLAPGAGFEVRPPDEAAR